MLFLLVLQCSLHISDSVQIEDCRTRYNGDADQHQRRNKFPFPARLLYVEIALRFAWTGNWQRMPLLTYAVASLPYIIHGLLRHVHAELWQIFLHYLDQGAS